MNNIQLFNHPQFGDLRVVDRDGRPWFIGKDVASSLGYANPAEAIRTHCKGVSEIRTPSAGGIQTVKIIPEADVYRLIMRSKLPDAERFQDWVMEEVLPAIHKDGGYIHANPDDTPESILARAVLVANDTIERLKSRIEQARPKELFADSVAGSESGILIGQLAKLICQNGVPIGQNRLFGWMRDNDYLIKQGDQRNAPTQKALEAGLFEIIERTIVPPDGKSRIVATTKVTGKGQVYFINKFLKVSETSDKESSHAHC
jgi:anti-repressor protein